jgi:hypothetical protein
MRRAIPIASLAVAAIVAGAASFAAEEPPAATSTVSSEKAPAAAPKSPVAANDNDDDDIDLSKIRLREGTQLRDVTGRFRQRGDSLLFIDDKNREINGLPNLNMERVLRMLKTVEEPESIAWSVSGTITEFSGENYLLISRAVYKSAAPPPAPENLSK